MDFSLNEEQRHWQSEARRFSDEEVRPMSLARDQIALSQRFSKPIPNKFEGVEYIDSANRMPLLAGTSAQFECRTEARHYSGDHVIFIGHVLQYSHADRDALGYHRGRYVSTSALDPS